MGKSGHKKCGFCGEDIFESGNYSVKILKAKRTPKKALRRPGNSGEEKSLVGLSEFDRFLIKRTNACNTIEITCGKCGRSSHTTVRKPRTFDNSLDPGSATTKTPQGSIGRLSGSGSGPIVSQGKKRKRGKEREVNAGLCFSSPTTTASSSAGRIHPSDPGTSSTSASGGRSLPSQSCSVRNRNSASDLNNLRKALFKSNKKKGGQQTRKATSLKDFLSSM